MLATIRILFARHTMTGGNLDTADSYACVQYCSSLCWINRMSWISRPSSILKFNSVVRDELGTMHSALMMSHALTEIMWA